jgi:transcriptional regulator with XRE-family HTH domain/tetratricopeptide (TPR) repeat protein
MAAAVRLRRPTCQSGRDSRPSLPTSGITSGRRQRMAPQRAPSTGPAARSFGRILRQRRQELRLTLEQVAELVPCSVQHLSEIERGVRYASLPLLVRIDWALSGVGALAGWASALIVEQLSLHQPVFATSRGRGPLDPATNTSGEELDAAAITARADELLAHLRRCAAMTPDERSAAAAGAPDAGLSSPGAWVHHGEDEPRDRDAALVEHILSGGSGQVGACPPLRLWLDDRPVLVRLLVVDVEIDGAPGGKLPPGGGMNRRTFIAIGGLGTLGTAAASASRVAHLSSANPRVLDYLEREAERLPLDFWAGSLAPLFPRIEDAYELANSLLGEPLRLRDQVRLHRVTARLAVLRAESEGFRGRLGAAERWYRLAGERAAEAGDAGLALWALARLAMTRAWTGADPQEVIEIAAEARHLSGGQPGAAASMLAAAEARAHARLGDRVALMENLRLAEAELGRAPSNERVPSVFAFTDAMRMLDVAAAWVLAGEPQEAEREARQAIALYAPWHRTDLAVVRLSLATALADQGRPDEACAMAREALPGHDAHPDDRIRLQSSWIVHGVSELDHHLERYQGMRVVQEFRESIDA